MAIYDVTCPVDGTPITENNAVNVPEWFASYCSAACREADRARQERIWGPSRHR